MNKKQIKKTKYLIQMRFKSLLDETIRLPFKSRLRVCRIILFKNKKLLNINNKQRN